MAERNEDVRARLIIRFACLVALVIFGAFDAFKKDYQVPFIVYALIGSFALGVDEVRKLFGGGGGKS